jgi:zinc transporter ZupT
MGPLDLALHLLSFAAPAFAVALGLALGARLFRLDRSVGRRWWVSVALNFVAGVAVLGAGLWYFGRDGKMATYAALVLVVATVQWVSGRSWAR